MNFFGQKKYSYTLVLLLPFVLLTAACGSLASPESETAEITSPSPEELPVEYGASLSEWEEATQVEAGQTANGVETNSEVTEASGSGCGRSNPNSGRRIR